jgi:hypothetical protein
MPPSQVLAILRPKINNDTSIFLTQIAKAQKISNSSRPLKKEHFTRRKNHYNKMENDKTHLLSANVEKPKTAHTKPPVELWAT